MRRINKSFETDPEKRQLLELIGKGIEIVIMTGFPMIKNLSRDRKGI